jgi:hypothetical protein
VQPLQVFDRSQLVRLRVGTSHSHAHSWWEKPPHGPRVCRAAARGAARSLAGAYSPVGRHWKSAFVKRGGLWRRLLRRGSLASSCSSLASTAAW